MSNTPIISAYGLAVCGGSSSRMGTDKSMLNYYGKPQRYYVYEMLQQFCEKVFISCNNEQANSIEAGYNFLTDHDAYQNTGPIAALLNAFDQFPGKDILFIGCDYPFLTPTDLQHFSANCKSGHPAAFYNEQEDLYEPLLAWYPNFLATALKTMYENKQYALQQFLIRNNAVKYRPQQLKSIQSVDSPEAYKEAYKIINTQ